MKTIIGRFESDEDANRAAEEFERRGFSRGNIRIEPRDPLGLRVGQQDLTRRTLRYGGVSAGVGAIVLGMIGLMHGYSFYALPGLGPIFPAGAWTQVLLNVLAGMALGAVAGGVIGVVVGRAAAEESPRVFLERIANGGALVLARSSNERMKEVRGLFEEAGATRVLVTNKWWEGDEKLVNAEDDPATIVGHFYVQEEEA
jgi:hypothetical protein